jgi:uncharacterized protein YhhL (DUF1145 family)
MLLNGNLSAYPSVYVSKRGRAMKNLFIFLACSVALSVVLYEIADYLTPGSPSAEMTILLTIIALVLVWLAQCAVRVSRHKKDSPQAAQKL